MADNNKKFVEYIRQRSSYDQEAPLTKEQIDAQVAALNSASPALSARETKNSGINQAEMFGILDYALTIKPKKPSFPRN